MHSFYSYNLYLAHYGIKRKSGRYPWGSGKRPYQYESKPHKLFAYNNYDGSLTKLGRKKVDKFVEKNKNINGLGRHYYNYDDLGTEDQKLKKGLYRYRVTDIDEPLDNKRKYLSDAYDYNYAYSDQFDILPASSTANKPGAIRYKLIKDINVKNAKDVYDYTLEKYGGDSINVIKDQEYLKDKGITAISMGNKYTRSLAGNKLANAIETVFKKDSIVSLFETNLDDISDYYKNNGYEAIQDILDSKYPDMKSAIVLNTPVKYLKQEYATQGFDVIAKNDKEYNKRMKKT